MCQHVQRLLSTEFLGFFFGESEASRGSDPALVSQYMAALGAAFRCPGNGWCYGDLRTEQAGSRGCVHSVGYVGDGREIRHGGLSLLERGTGGAAVGCHGQRVLCTGTNQESVCCSNFVGSAADINQSWAGHHVCRLGGSAYVPCDNGYSSQAADCSHVLSEVFPGRCIDGRMDGGSPCNGVDERGDVASRSEVFSGGEAVDHRRTDAGGDEGFSGDSSGGSGGSKAIDTVCNNSASGGGRSTVSERVRTSGTIQETVVENSSVGCEISEKTLANRARRMKARERKKRKQANQRVSSSLPVGKMSWRETSVSVEAARGVKPVVSAVDEAKETLAEVWVLRNKREKALLLSKELADGDGSGAHAARLSALDKEEQAALIERRIAENQVKKAKAEHEFKVLQARNLAISVEKDRVAQLAAVERGRVSVEKAHASLKSSGSSSFAETLLSSGSVSPNSSISQQELLNLEKRKLDLERENEENKDVIKDLIALVRSTDDGGEVTSRVKVYMKKKEKALSWLTLDEHGSVDQAEIDKRFPSGWDAVIHEDIGKVHIEPAYGVTQLSGGKYERVAYGNTGEDVGAEGDNLSDASVLTGDNLVRKLRDLELLLAR